MGAFSDQCSWRSTSATLSLDVDAHLSDDGFHVAPFDHLNEATMQLRVPSRIAQGHRPTSRAWICKPIGG
jgi:hypothetical protein